MSVVVDLPAGYDQCPRMSLFLFFPSFSFLTLFLFLVASESSAPLPSVDDLFTEGIDVCEGLLQSFQAVLSQYQNLRRILTDGNHPYSVPAAVEAVRAELGLPPSNLAAMMAAASINDDEEDDFWSTYVQDGQSE